YVPIYPPDQVYAEPSSQPGLYLSFGPAWPVGPWLNHDFDWAHHHVLVWHHDHPRPSDWWSRSAQDRPREIARNNVSVWRAERHGTWSDQDREARGWGTAGGRSYGPSAPSLPHGDQRQEIERRA